MDLFLDPNAERLKILFLGEGNFSFCRSLIQQNVKHDVYATCFESEESANESTMENIAILKSFGVKIFFGIDATTLEENTIPTKTWDRIIFNFPHIGGKMKIQKNRDLLKNFGHSASKVIEKKEGCVIVTLCDGQGGTPYDHVKRIEADSWQIVKMMSYGNFGMIGARKLQLEQFPGYKPFGYRSQDKGFHVDQATIHIFQIFPSIVQKIDISSSTNPVFLRKMIFAPTYEHDISFWIPNNDLSENMLKEVLDQESKCSVTKIDPIDVYHSKEKDQTSRTYRLTYSNDEFIINPIEVMNIHYSIGKALMKKYNVVVR